jgi:hypothetical protein
MTSHFFRLQLVFLFINRIKKGGSDEKNIYYRISEADPVIELVL